MIALLTSDAALWVYGGIAVVCVLALLVIGACLLVDSANRRWARGVL
jgi:hypothetical protein